MPTPPPSASPRFVSIPQAAEHWSVSPRFIRTLIADGTLQARRIPGRRVIRVDLNELDRLMQPIPTTKNRRGA